MPDSTGGSHTGFLTADDLAAFQPRVEPPVSVMFDAVAGVLEEAC